MSNLFNLKDVQEDVSRINELLTLQTIKLNN
jgi:hypothetical protein